MTFFIRKPIQTLTCVTLGFIIRLITMALFKETISQRVEVTTPIGSWKRAYEGVYLWKSGLNPYSGSILHEYPISLQIYKVIISYFNENIIFASVDVLTAILLHYSVYKHKIIALSKESTNNLNGVDIESAKSESFQVLVTYLFSPITIMSCAGLSTSLFTNVLISLIMFIIPIKSCKTFACVLCAFLACNNLHYIALILPIFLCLEYVHQDKNIEKPPHKNDQDRGKTNSIYYQDPDFFSKISSSAMILFTTLATLLLTSYLLMGRNWNFLDSTYLFVLKVQDQTPNVGMFWYFFTEVFETFSDFFAWTAQINAFIHVIPLSISLRDQPFFLLYVNILTSTIFHPYPSLSNLGLITSLLPQWSYLFEHMRKGLIVICAGVVCLSLCPVFWHLWIIMGTANSNFYFGATLAFNVSLILFLNDILNAHTYHDAKVRFGHHNTPERIAN